MLAELREDKKLSQRKLAAKIGKSPSFVSSLEAGKRGASAATIKKIGDALELGPTDRLKLSEWVATRTDPPAAKAA
jgi:transcriptional regulator with XRE-family HTH domain